MSEKKSAVRDRLLSKSRRRSKPTSVPNMDGVFICSLSEPDRAEIEDFDPRVWGWSDDEFAAMKPDEVARLGVQTIKRRLCVHGVRDEAGDKLFTRDDVRGVLASDDWDSVITDALADEVLDFNGMGGETLQTLLGEPDAGSDNQKTS